MPLDIFQQDENEAVRYAGAHSGLDLPATYSETFHASWMNGVLFGQSTAALNARTAAAADYADEIEQLTGDRTLKAALASGGLERMNKRISQIAAERSDTGIAPLDEETLTQRQAARSRVAVDEYRRIGDREKTLGGSLGLFAGSAASGITDPVNVLTFPIAAPEALGVIGTAAAWAGIGAGTQTVIELAGSPYRERIEPGYMTSGEPLGNIAGAAVFAGALGGTLRGAQVAWSALKERGGWSRSLRDAGNVVDSETNVASTNPLRGVEGETVHRQALSKAIDDLAADRPVDVDGIVPPELQGAYEARFTTIAEARLRAAETRAPEDVGDVAFELQGMAREAGYVLPRQDADSLAARLVDMPENEARATLDEFLHRPQTLAHTLSEPVVEPGAPMPARGREYDSALAAETNPRRASELPSDPVTDDVVLRNLDRLRLERPDMEMPVGESIGADGRAVPVMRRVDDVLSEADTRQLAAREIIDCVGTYPEAAE